LSTEEFMYRAARIGSDLNELELIEGSFRVTKGLFPSAQFHSDGVSVYLSRLLASLGLDVQEVFNPDCYPNSQVEYTHVAKIPVSALFPTDVHGASHAELLEDPHRDCCAGRAHGLIRALAGTKRRDWVSIRDRLISRATIISRG
jgi:hypothetical protein